MKGIRRVGGGVGRIFVIGLFSFLVPAFVLHNQTLASSKQHNLGGMPNNNNEQQLLDDKTTPKARSTLVHFDPYFMGGFRNQHMRFVAFVSFAVKNNISQILLPSLRWVDPYNKPNSIHHELLFDVPYWNSRAESLGLPFLVYYDPNVLEGIIIPENNATGSSIGSSIGSSNKNNESSTEVIACWDETTSLYSGLDGKFLRSPTTNLRKTRTWDMIGKGERYSHCRRTLGENGENDPDKIEEAARRDVNSMNEKVYRFTHLVPHGGLISSGRLWWEYNALQDGRGKASETKMINGEMVPVHPEHVPVERAVYQLLRPSKHLRVAFENAISVAMSNATITPQQHARKSGRRPRLLALHPRVEQEMLTHRCSKYMESSLTKAFEKIKTFPPFLDVVGYRFDLLFLAVSKKEIDKPTSQGGALGDVMNQNRDALRNARKYGLFCNESSNGNISNAIPIFESGTDSAAKIRFPRIQPRTEPRENRTIFDSPQSLGVLELVASIINFFTVVSADIFVGVRGSTYSTDAFSVRYYQQKENGGGENYILSHDGIERLYGPAPPHLCI